MSSEADQFELTSSGYEWTCPQSHTMSMREHLRRPRQPMPRTKPKEGKPMSYTYRGKGTAPKTCTEPSLLTYVITYLQEEQRTVDRWDDSVERLRELVTDALDAYEGGAR